MIIVPGKTMIEKIVVKHSKDEIKPGNVVWMDIDIRTARDFAGASVVNHLERHYSEGQRIADVGRTFFTFDCVVPANNIGYAVNQHIIRKFARKEGIKVYDVNSGIGSHVAIEQGFAYPGCTFVGTDSHLNILGSIGALGQGMGDQDIAFTFKAGKTWFEVPQSVKINVKGKMASNSTPKDLTLALVKHFGSAGLLGLSAEFYGQPIDTLTLDGRITLASMITEMGGIIGLIPPNKEVVSFCKERSRSRKLFDRHAPIYADEDASYQETIEIDVDGLKPQIACPYSPENVKDIAEVAGTKVDSVIIGSCTNGRYSDIELAAKMIEGRKVHERVMFKIVPGEKLFLIDNLELECYIAIVQFKINKIHENKDYFMRIGYHDFHIYNNNIHFEGHEFDIRYEMDQCVPLGVAAYQCKTELRKIQIRKLTEKEIAAANKRSPRKKQPSAEDDSKPKTAAPGK